MNLNEYGSEIISVEKIKSAVDYNKFKMKKEFGSSSNTLLPYSILSNGNDFPIFINKNKFDNEKGVFYNLGAVSITFNYDKAPVTDDDYVEDKKFTFLKNSAIITFL